MPHTITGKIARNELKKLAKTYAVLPLKYAVNVPMIRKLIIKMSTQNQTYLFYKLEQLSQSKGVFIIKDED